MVDWEHKDRPDVFCNVAVDDVGERLSGLFERYQPDVVVTYDEPGSYDHPAHVHASRVPTAAVARTGIPRKAYRPRTNGKVERFNGTLLTELAYARPYASESARAAALPRWLHLYNHHRHHTAIGGLPPRPEFLTCVVSTASTAAPGRNASCPGSPGKGSTLPERVRTASADCDYC